MDKKNNKRIVLIVIAVIISTTIIALFFAKIEKSDHKKIMQILSYTIQNDSQKIIDDYPKILYGELSEYFKKNYSDFFKNNDYDSVFFSLKSVYWLSMAKTNEFSNAANDILECVNEQNVKQVTRNLWLTYNEEYKSLNKQQTEQFFDSIYEIDFKEHNEVSLNIDLFLYYTYQYLNKSDKAENIYQQIKEQIIIFHSDKTVESFFNDLKFEYFLAPLICDNYDDFQPFFVLIYTDSPFCNTEIDILISRKIMTDSEEVYQKRKEILLSAVKELYDSEKIRLGSDSIQLKLMEDTISSLSK